MQLQAVATSGSKSSVHEPATMVAKSFAHQLVT
jgi:hypothetical protein